MNIVCVYIAVYATLAFKTQPRKVCMHGNSSYQRVGRLSMLGFTKFTQLHVVTS